MEPSLNRFDRERAVATSTNWRAGRLAFVALALFALLSGLFASSPASATGNGQVVMLGDSIIENWASNANGFFPGKPYVNKGITGQTTSQIAKRFDRDVLALRPSVVVLQGGINDLNENVSAATISRIERNFSSMTDKAKAKGIRVVIVSVFPVAFRPGGMTVFNARRPNVTSAVSTANARLKSLAAKKGVTYLDVYSSITDARGELAEKYNSDNVHITYAAYDLITPMVERAVATASR